MRILWGSILSFLAAILVLGLTGAHGLLSRFDGVTVWQVLCYIREPISLLPPAERKIAWGCILTACLVFVLAFALYLSVIGWFGRRFGLKGVVFANFAVCVFLFEGYWFAFEYLDDMLGLRYEIQCWMGNSTLFRDEFVAVDSKTVPFPEGRKNLIVLVGESIEDSFMSGENGDPVLMPRLKAWGGSHDSWGTMHTVHGTDHTICSLFGMTYGVPRLPINGSFWRVSLVDYPEVRFPNVWEVWTGNGFVCTFMKGGEIGFARTDRVFKSVPNVEILDKSAFEHDPDYLMEPHKHVFGVNDEVVIRKRLKTETMRLAECGKPFVLMAWTLNTHYPGGWRSKFRPRKSTDRFKDAIMQADDAIVDYVEWAGSQDFMTNTALVVVGDHLFHGKFDFMTIKRRHPFHAFERRNASSPRSKHDFAAFDLAATFLELTGARLEKGRFGIGRSLLREEPTLLDRIGTEKYETEMRACGADYRLMAFGTRGKTL